jgi:trehalose 6-phosphate synthase
VLSGGGPVAALQPLAARLPLTWVSLASNDAEVDAVRTRRDGVYEGPPLPADWSARLAAVPRRVAHRHYNLICNPLLWFLHHRIWGPSHTPNVDNTLVDAWDNGHIPVTLAYATEIESESRRVGRPLLLNTRDYTLPLLPGVVRARLPDSLIMHSSDVPWPGPDWWLLLPAKWRDAIFRSLLACDAITFPTARDLRSFAACAREFVPGAQDQLSGSIVAGDHETKVAVAPAGVDPAALLEFSASSRVRSEARNLQSQDEIHEFVSVDRAEPHKNIVRSLRAFGRMLELAPELAGRVRYLLVLAPPPPHGGQYRRYVDEIKSAATDIERRYRRPGWTPVELHLERNYAKAMAALTSYDTLVSVPLADGTSGSVTDGAIVNRRNGSLIVSEMSPAVELLGDFASVVSPADVEGLAFAMLRSIEADPPDRATRAAHARDATVAWTRESAIRVELSVLANRI